jgi:excisionase family DNA binding protein
MAGKFLTLEEAARQLGVTVDEVHRLVDRKKLFPMRDGATVKFKAEEVERVSGDLGEESSRSDALSLDLELDLPAAAGGSSAAGGPESIALGEPLDIGESIFATDAADDHSASQTLVRGGGGQASPASDLSIPAAGSGIDVDFASPAADTDDDDMSLEQIAGASSPSLLSGINPTAAGPKKPESGLAIDLSGIGGGSGATGSLLGASIAAAGVSGVLGDSGLSLEGGDAQLSGIDIAGGTSQLSGGSLADGSLLGSDEFQLGSDTGDDDSASVVIATDDSSDSSSFGMGGGEDESSDFSGSASSSADLETSTDMAAIGDYTLETPFSALQVVGLICCSLLLLFGGFVALDVVQSIGSREGPWLANPILDAMADSFGWRR